MADGLCLIVRRYGLSEDHQGVDDAGKECSLGSAFSYAGGYGTGCGAFSAAVVLGLTAIFFLRNPYSPEVLTGGTLLMGLMALLAFVAGASALTKRPGPLLFMFVFSFVPVGTYLMGTPGVFRWIGVADLGYLVAAVCLVSGQVQLKMRPGQVK